MINKYRLTDATIECYGRTLHQIEALRDIERFDVKAGDFGGWVEKYDNLSQDGDAWVFGNAQVSGDARVFGNAQVSGDARVFGNAWVFGNARVSGDAQVSTQYDLITVSNIGSRDATTSFYRIKQGGIYVTCGCFSGSIDTFEARVKQVHGDNRHGTAYMAAIALARSIVNAEPV